MGPKVSDKGTKGEGNTRVIGKHGGAREGGKRQQGKERKKGRRKKRGKKASRFRSPTLFSPLSSTSLSMPLFPSASTNPNGCRRRCMISQSQGYPKAAEAQKVYTFPSCRRNSKFVEDDDAIVHSTGEERGGKREKGGEGGRGIGVRAAIGAARKNDQGARKQQRRQRGGSGASELELLPKETFRNPVIFFLQHIFTALSLNEGDGRIRRRRGESETEKNPTRAG